jgi:hypothetical protein
MTASTWAAISPASAVAVGPVVGVAVGPAVELGVVEAGWAVAVGDGDGDGVAGGVVAAAI